MADATAASAATSEKIGFAEGVKRTIEKLEAEFSMVKTKTHRFPASLQGISVDGYDHYIVPNMVALGPYHHGLPKFKEMEEVKHAAAHYFCEVAAFSVGRVYEIIRSDVAGHARRCYPADAVAGISNDDFAAMMFLDGCFLLQYMDSDFDRQNPLLLHKMVLSTGPCILRDIMLLGNQIPWLALMALRNVAVHDFITDMTMGFSMGERQVCFDANQTRYKPPHLLGLLRFYLVGSMNCEEVNTPAMPHSLSSSAIELAQIGINLTASKKAWLGDMSIEKGPLFSELSLQPVFLDDITACWLVNMAALEACTATDYPSDGYAISSYLSLLAMLLDREEDVQKLRVKHLLRSFFSNQQTLAFFKALAKHLRLGHRYFTIIAEIEAYKRERRVTIAVYKFLYINFKTIVTVSSIIGVLVGIFKTLLSLKQHL